VCDELDISIPEKELRALSLLHFGAVKAAGILRKD